MIMRRISENQHEKTDRSCVVSRRIMEDLQERCCGRLNDPIDVSCNEKQDDEEDQPGENTDANASNHDPRSDHRGVRDF